MLRRLVYGSRALPVVAVAALVGCGAQSHAYRPVQSVPSAKARIPGQALVRIAVVVMENKEYGEVIGTRSAPYINGLAKRYALATRMLAITHPSLPNYLALTGGSTFGITSDCTACNVRATSLVDQLATAGVSWKGYMEDYPGHCFAGGNHRGYAKKHNPFLYYTRISRDPARCSQVVPLSQLGADERAGTLPRFTWISPNLCHDMHDCDVATGDRFLSGLVPPLLRALGPRGLLILTWDEGASDSSCCRLAAGGHIATILAGPVAKAKSRMSTPADHYSVLQTIEDLFSLPRLRGAACTCTPSLQPLLAH